MQPYQLKSLERVLDLNVLGATRDVYLDHHLEVGNVWNTQAMPHSILKYGLKTLVNFETL